LLGISRGKGRVEGRGLVQGEIGDVKEREGKGVLIEVIAAGPTERESVSPLVAKKKERKSSEEKGRRGGAMEN